MSSYRLASSSLLEKFPGRLAFNSGMVLLLLFGLVEGCSWRYVHGYKSLMFFRVSLGVGGAKFRIFGRKNLECFGGDEWNFLVGSVNQDGVNLFDWGVEIGWGDSGSEESGGLDWARAGGMEGWQRCSLLGARHI